ncbi:MAG: hypothetical protein WDZ80_04075 [Candidatus Paceibacterota bacterium]
MFNLNKKGQIALPFVLLIGGIIVEIVIAGSIVSFFVNAASLGERLSVRALAAANTGVYDAMEKISSNKEFSVSPVEYEIIIGDDSVTVNVSRVEDAGNNVYEYTISAIAVAESRQRKMQAIVFVDQTTGQLNLNSIEEQPVQ